MTNRDRFLTYRWFFGTAALTVLGLLALNVLVKTSTREHLRSLVSTGGQIRPGTEIFREVEKKLIPGVNVAELSEKYDLDLFEKSQFLNRWLLQDDGRINIVSLPPGLLIRAIQDSPPDVLFIGSSLGCTGFRADIFAQSVLKATGEHLRVLNLSVCGLNPEILKAFTKNLQPYFAQHPAKLIIYMASPRDLNGASDWAPWVVNAFDMWNEGMQRGLEKPLLPRLPTLDYYFESLASYDKGSLPTSVVPPNREQALEEFLKGEKFKAEMHDYDAWQISETRSADLLASFAMLRGMSNSLLIINPPLSDPYKAAIKEKNCIPLVADLAKKNGYRWQWIDYANYGFKAEHYYHFFNKGFDLSHVNVLGASIFSEKLADDIMKDMPDIAAVLRARDKS